MAVMSSLRMDLLKTFILETFLVNESSLIRLKREVRRIKNGLATCDQPHFGYKNFPILFRSKAKTYFIFRFRGKKVKAHLITLICELHKALQSEEVEEEFTGDIKDENFVSLYKSELLHQLLLAIELSQLREEQQSELLGRKREC